MAKAVSVEEFEAYHAANLAALTNRPTLGAGGAGSTLYVDAANGSDATGQRGTLRSYATLAQALADYEGGDLISVAPGTYVPTVNLYADDVRWHLAPGAVIETTNAPEEALVLAGGAGQTWRIAGRGVLRNLSPEGAADNQDGVRVDGPSTVHVEAAEVAAPNGYSLKCLGAGTIVFDVDTLVGGIDIVNAGATITGTYRHLSGSNFVLENDGGTIDVTCTGLTESTTGNPIENVSGKVVLRGGRLKGLHPDHTVLGHEGTETILIGVEIDSPPGAADAWGPIKLYACRRTDGGALVLAGGAAEVGSLDPALLDAKADAVTVVEHGYDADTARPAISTPVEWRGFVWPTNLSEADNDVLVLQSPLAPDAPALTAAEGTLQITAPLGANVTWRRFTGRAANGSVLFQTATDAPDDTVTVGGLTAVAHHVTVAFGVAYQVPSPTTSDPDRIVTKINWSDESDAVEATPTAAQDSSAPAVADLAASPGDGAVTLSGTYPADLDLAVARFYRGTASGFTRNASTLLRTVAAPTPGAAFSFDDDGSYDLAAPTNGVRYYYVVETDDEVPNTGLSNEATALPYEPVAAPPALYAFDGTELPVATAIYAPTAVVGTTATDLSGNGHDATLAPATNDAGATVTVGTVGGGPAFILGGGHLDPGPQADWAVPAREGISVYYRGTLVAGKRILNHNQQGMSTNANVFIEVRMEAAGEITFAVRGLLPDNNKRTEVKTVAAPAAVGDGEEHTLAAVYDGGSTPLLFLDGELLEVEFVGANRTLETVDYGEAFVTENGYHMRFLASRAGTVALATTGHCRLFAAWFGGCWTTEELALLDAYADAIAPPENPAFVRPPLRLAREIGELFDLSAYTTQPVAGVQITHVANLGLTEAAFGAEFMLLFSTEHAMSSPWGVFVGRCDDYLGTNLRDVTNVISTLPGYYQFEYPQPFPDPDVPGKMWLFAHAQRNNHPDGNRDPVTNKPYQETHAFSTTDGFTYTPEGVALPVLTPYDHPDDGPTLTQHTGAYLPPYMNPDYGVPGGDYEGHRFLFVSILQGGDTAFRGLWGTNDLGAVWDLLDVIPASGAASTPAILASYLRNLGGTPATLDLPGTGDVLVIRSVPAGYSGALPARTFAHLFVLGGAGDLVEGRETGPFHLLGPGRFGPGSHDTTGLNVNVVAPGYYVVMTAIENAMYGAEFTTED